MIRLSLFLLFILFSCGHHKKADYRKNVEQYRAKGQELVDKVGRKKIKPKEVELTALDLISQAKTIIEYYQFKKSECRELLTKIVSESTKMTKLTLDQIEKDYHEGEVLPKASEDCYGPKELVVHPATVVILTQKDLNKESRGQIIDEMEEVLAHLDLLLD